MIPLYDNIPSRTTPVVNYCLIAVCCFVFFRQIPDGDGQLIMRYGMIPARVSNPSATLEMQRPEVLQTPLGQIAVVRTVPIPPAAVPDLVTLLSCTFLHGSLMHLAGNMLFLYIFGDNVEDRLGHVGYLLFYLGCGVTASVAHSFSNSSSLTPTIGASGAVAGVMGAYLLLYPHAKVVSLVPIFIILHIMVIPAPVFLGLWFLLQLLQGTFSMNGTAAQGVAWWAHVGGFVAGYLLVRFLVQRGRTTPQVTVVRPGTERTAFVRVPRRQPPDSYSSQDR